MQQSNAWESPRRKARLMAPQGWQKAGGRRTAQTFAVDESAAVGGPALLRSRTRTRRRRRKRSWGAPWAYLLPVFLVITTVQLRRGKLHAHYQ